MRFSGSLETRRGRCLRRDYDARKGWKRYNRERIGRCPKCRSDRNLHGCRRRKNRRPEFRRKRSHSSQNDIRRSRRNRSSRREGLASKSRRNRDEISNSPLGKEHVHRRNGHGDCKEERLPRKKSNRSNSHWETCLSTFRRMLRTRQAPTRAPRLQANGGQPRKHVHAQCP